MSFCSESKPNQRADAPEATITVRVSIHSPSTSTRNGWPESSASKTSPWTYSAPKFSACFLIFSTRSGPLMPSGKPEKSSTNVVIDNCPPACFPATTRGFKLARAAYTAAVFPAQPDPIISTFRIWELDVYNVAPWRAGNHARGGSQPALAFGRPQGHDDRPVGGPPVSHRIHRDGMFHDIPQPILTRMR